LLVAWLPVVLWAALILWFSAQPADDLPDVGFQVPDKLVHASIYAVLGALVARALRRRGAVVALAAIAAIAAFGLFDEWTQHFSPGRQPDLADALADTLGAAAGYLAAMRYYRRPWRSSGPSATSTR
jgi:VanZ family protein